MALVVLAVLAVLAPVSAAATPAGGVGEGRSDRLDLYEVTADVGTDAELREEGFDVVGTGTAPGDGAMTIELVLTDGQAQTLRRRRGLTVARMRGADGPTTTDEASPRVDESFDVWRRWDAPGGLKEEMELLARRFRDRSQLVTIGESVNGQPIYALRVTAGARGVEQGTRPAVLYVSTQHAREWIGTEVNRRLLRHVLEAYGHDDQVTRLVDTTELWFVLVANPDGYDRSFEAGQRLWRKNLRDNDGDGRITTDDGVDLDRNYPTKWGYDDEGSSSEPSGQTYRGTGPASEPETQALDGLLSRIAFSFLVDYHAAAARIRYGVGWQVDTPTPDDAIYAALAGTDAKPAIEGYDPDLSAERSVADGTIADHAHAVYGTLAFTPELGTCQTATAYDPDDGFGPTFCDDEARSAFEFPDSEPLVRAEFEKNLGFALAVAESADDPGDPVSPVGTPAQNFVIDEFDTSYGAPQEVAVRVRRALTDLRMHYAVNGGPARRVTLEEWQGGARYGDTHDVWYAEYRGTVDDIGTADEVEVWFTARDPDAPGEPRGGRAAPAADAARPRRVESRHVAFRVHGDSDADVLIVADNSPGTSLGGTAPLAHLAAYTAALEANRYSWEVYDVGVDGPAPHPLGVLGHFRAVIWYEGAKLVTDYQGGVDTTPLAHQVTMHMRDYLNEGGRILATGGNHGFEEFLPLRYGDNADPTTRCADPSGLSCLPLSNDTYQYYFGGYRRIRRGGPDAAGRARGVHGVDTPYAGVDWLADGVGAAPPDQPGAGTAGSAMWLTTSSVLPAERFPQFTSWRSAAWVNGGRAAFEPVTGEWQVATDHDDGTYKRLTRRIDLRGVANASLDLMTSYRVEHGRDHFFVEARTVGEDDWTTLPDRNGHTGRDTGQSCPDGWADGLHPQLDHYQTRHADGTCSPNGTTGEWHATTGASDGVEHWSIDLSQYAERKVEVSLTYATDEATGDLGVFVDDVAVTGDKALTETSFEADLGGWKVVGPPAGTRGGSGGWERVGVHYEIAAAVSTEDTILHGFGLEDIADAEQRAELMRRSMEHLIGGP